MKADPTTTGRQLKVKITPTGERLTPYRWQLLNVLSGESLTDGKGRSRKACHEAARLERTRIAEEQAKTSGVPACSMAPGYTPTPKGRFMGDGYRIDSNRIQREN